MKDTPEVMYPAGTVFHCLRCDADWATRKDGKPKACGKCKSAYWDRPEQSIPRASRGVGTLPA